MCRVSCFALSLSGPVNCTSVQKQVKLEFAFYTETANLDMRKKYWSTVKVALYVCWSMISIARFTLIADTGGSSKPRRGQTRRAEGQQGVEEGFCTRSGFARTRAMSEG